MSLPTILSCCLIVWYYASTLWLRCHNKAVPSYLMSFHTATVDFAAAFTLVPWCHAVRTILFWYHDVMIPYWFDTMMLWYQAVMIPCYTLDHASMLHSAWCYTWGSAARPPWSFVARRALSWLFTMCCVNIAHCSAQNGKEYCYNRLVLE